jgi:hypothetical protein
MLTCEAHPNLVAFPENDAVEAWEWPDEATLTLTIDHAPGLSWSGTASPTPWGDPRTFFRFEFGSDYDLQVGDEVTVTDGTTSRPHIVQNLAVTEVNGDEDTVTGTADTGAVVQVWPHETGQLLEDTAVDGSWQVDFSGLFDLVKGTCGRSQIPDDAGNATAVDWCIPNPRIIASITDDWFRVEEFPQSAPLDMAVYASQGGDLLWEDHTRTTDENGFAWMNLWEPNLDLKPSMYLVVASGDVAKDIVLENVLLYVFDTDADYLAGSAPPDRQLWVGTGNEDYGCGMDVMSGPDGAWAADFASQPCDVVPSMWAAVQAFDGDGDATEANPGFPRGSHDYDTGDVPNWACNAGGGVFDPDDQGRPVPIRIFSDASFGSL